MRAISGNSSYTGTMDAAGNVNSTGTYDGVITLNAAKLIGFGGNGPYSAGRVIQHEVDEVLGIGGSGSTLGSSLQSTNYAPLDLFRYSGAHTPSYTTSSTATSYFSIDGGNTNIVNFNQNPGTNGQTGGDFGDWGSQGTTGNYVQLAFTSSSQGAASVSLTSPEGIALQAVGYDATPEPSSLAISAALLCGVWFTLRRRGVGRG
ncbi:MAG: PEP-CTERM sorting domain-containing protein [Phycisphaerae bacterium]